MDETMPDIAQLYERIPPEEVREFARAYLAYHLERSLQQIDERIAALRADLAVNDAQEAKLRPTDGEFAAIEFLQARGVQDVDLLDRLVERGENWLTQTVRRLTYFEGISLAPTDYCQWCEYALEGAYDWIDTASLNHSDTASASSESRAADAGEQQAIAPVASESARASQPLAEIEGSAKMPDSPHPAAEAAADGPVWLIQPEESDTLFAIDQPTSPIPLVSPPPNSTTAPAAPKDASESSVLSAAADETAGDTPASDFDLAGGHEQRLEEDGWLRRSQAIATRIARVPIAPPEEEPSPHFGWRSLFRIFKHGTHALDH
jgi:hypothetical protein